MVIDFMDLNVDDEQNSVFDAESATSNSNSSVVNGDVGDATNSNDVSNEDTLSDNVFTFNFGILKVNGAAGGVADEEVVESRTEVESRSGFVTRELFPVSGNKEPPCRSWSADLLPFVPQQQRQGGHQTKQLQQKPSTPQVKKGRRGPRSRSSEYRGVTFYRRTGRWESHIWDCGKQIYLGGFDTAHAAARAYDRAAIQFRGADADINFSLCDYEEDLKQMKHLSKVDFVHILRRQSNGSSRRNSKYRSVSVHDTGKWEAQLGQQQLLGKKFQDQAPIKCDNRKEPVTKFEPSSYESEVVSGSQIEDNHHDLDLNLGMSNNSLKAKTECQRNVVKYHPYDVQNRKIHKIDSSRTTNIPPTRPRPLTLQNMQLWPGVCSDSSPNSKEIKAKDRIVGVGSSNEPQKWAWQMQGQLIATPMTAASSGFSSPVTTGFSASHLLKSQGSSTALNLCFSSYRA